jgi:hypothetical protein
MITFTEEDLAKLKDEIEELRRVCAEVNLPMGETGGVPWQIPHDVNCYLTWRFRRITRKVEGICAEFRASMEGIMDVIACCAGIMEGTEDNPQTYTEPDWSRNLGRAHEELCEKLGRPDRHSIDGLTNAMNSFLDQSRLAMQELAKAAN